MKQFNSNITFIDLFAGIGGFRIAMEHYGATCVFSSEIDNYAKQTYSTNFDDMPHGDITLISETIIPKHDVLCAGFPCQAFSISGKQKGFEDARGTLFFEIIRIVNFHKPKLLLLENVANLKNHSDGETINHMVSLLKDIGYTVFFDILNASNFGVPQSRKRIYFVCFRNDINVKNFNFPKPTKKDIALEDVLLPDHITKDYIIYRDDINIQKTEPTNRTNKPIRIGTINKGGQGERIYSPKGHAITLSANGGGAGAKTGAYLINGKVRKLCPEECKLVQGFPSNYIIPVNDSQAWKQFGNTVAIPVLEAIIESILELNII
ncbi:MAG TPA: DNA (cytosine-5-)-methyltransferase [Lachnospiraceae bacterium]|nr:DNA (cytosine-5-)-methyltransferase [Lachnospiraceae bacterium]